MTEQDLVHRELADVSRRLDALEAWRDRQDGCGAEDTPRQEAPREWWVYLSANKPSALYITDGKWPFAGVETFKVRETRPTDREVWMRQTKLAAISGYATRWTECSPDDEGAVRFVREGE